MISKFIRWKKLPLDRAPRICIVIPYFGPWPEWMEPFLESCRFNDFVEWKFFTDNSAPQPDIPPNVSFQSTQLSDFLKLVEHKLKIRLEWDNPYKICDLRPAFGVVFAEQLTGYDFWGWGDIDVIYGNMRLHLTQDIMANDCISFSKEHLSGHLCIWRNRNDLKDWYKALPDWRQRMESEKYSGLDESSPSLIPVQISVHAEYSFNTPLSPKTPWTDGTFNCPSEWYWNNGSLTNDIDGEREFLYLHFMHWKGGWWPRQCGNAQWEGLPKLVHFEHGQAKNGFCINERGFFPLLDRPST